MNRVVRAILPQQPHFVGQGVAWALRREVTVDGVGLVGSSLWSSDGMGASPLESSVSPLVPPGLGRCMRWRKDGMIKAEAEASRKV